MRGLWAGLALAVVGGAALADSASTVTLLRGTLSIQRPDGTVLILSREPRINFSDPFAEPENICVPIDFFGRRAFPR